MTRFEDLPDGFKANGQPWLDPEGQIELYAANPATGEVTYLVSQAAGRYVVKHANVNSQMGPVSVGLLTKLQGRQEFEGSLLIIDPRGRIVAKTPYPEKIAGLAIGALSPYSAFQTSGVMLEAISNQAESITYANGFAVSERSGRKVLLFSWVIDSASYADVHLHQVQEMGFQDGELVLVSEPKLYGSS